MTYELTEQGRAAWKAKLSSQRKRAGKGQKALSGGEGTSVSTISRFESGEEAVLRAWFADERAANYAAGIGVTLETLERWLQEAAETTAPAEPWHPAFPTLTLDEAFISPPFTVEGLGEGPARSVTELIDALGRVEGPVVLRVQDARGAGRPSFVRMLARFGLPANTRLGEADPRPASGGAPTAAPGCSAGEVVVTVELGPWTEATIGALAGHLRGIGALDERTSGGVEALREKMRAERLETGPSTAIALLGHAVAGGVDSSTDIVAMIAATQWGLATEGAAQSLVADWRCLFRFWARRRVEVAGPSWLAPARAEANACMGRVCGELGSSPLDAAAARAAFAALRAAKGPRRLDLEDSFERRLHPPNPGALVDGLVRGGVLLEGERWMEAADPRLAVAFAAAGLRDRLEVVAADDSLGWALDPSWRGVLLRLGRIGADPAPLLRCWRSLPVWVRGEGAVALVHLLAAGPGEHPLAEGVLREIHAAAVWRVLSLRTPVPFALRPLGFLGFGVREIASIFLSFSQTWAKALGQLGPLPADTLAARLPPDLLRHPPFSVGPFLTILQGNSDIPESEYADIAVTCLSPWQCPPLDESAHRRWWTVEAVARMVHAPLPAREEVLERAAELGHREAASVLAGATATSATGPEVRNVPEVRPLWSPVGTDCLDCGVPIYRDGWRSLSYGTRCRWVGRSGSAEDIQMRLVELIACAGEEPDVEALLAAARRLGPTIVERALRRLCEGTPKGAAGVRSFPAWVLHNPENAHLVRRLGEVVGARSALELLQQTVRVNMAHRRPELVAALTSEPRVYLHGAREHRQPELGPATAAIRRLGHVEERSTWIPLTAALVARAMAWEDVRLAAATTLADLGSPQLLRERALAGPRWSWSERACDTFDLELRLAELTARGDAVSLVDLARWPTPEPDANEFLARLRERGLARAQELGIPDDGTCFPPACGETWPAAIQIRQPAWLARRAHELDTLPRPLQPPWDGARRSILVLAWLCTSVLPFPRVERGDLSDTLWQWLADVADAYSGHSPSRVALQAIDSQVRASAVEALITRQDRPLLVALFPSDEERDGSHDAGRAQVGAALGSDPKLRKAVWESAPSERARAEAYSSAARAGSKERWVQAEEERRRGVLRAELLADPDPLRRVAAALQPTCPLGVEEAEDLVVQWWSGPEPLTLPWERAFDDAAHPFDGAELIGYVTRRVQAGSPRLCACVRTLWHAVLGYPFVLTAPRRRGEVGLVLQSRPGELWRAVVELLRAVDPSDALLREAWDRAAPERVDMKVGALLGADDAWADDEDLAAPVSRADVHRCWLLDGAADRLDESVLDPDRHPPGAVRALLRSRLAALRPEALLDWVAARLATIKVEESGGEWSTLWDHLADLDPGAAWAWLQRRAEQDPEWLDFMRGAVLAVEWGVPGARRWLVEALAARDGA